MYQAYCESNLVKRVVFEISILAIIIISLHVVLLRTDPLCEGSLRFEWQYLGKGADESLNWR